MLNLGQGTAWDAWYGRGVRTNHPEDYPEYMKGGDIISFDIYPVNATHKDVKNKLWKVPFGLDRMRKWSADKKPLWTVIETTAYGSVDRRPSPHQVKAMVWMSLVQGAKSIMYFVHECEVKDASDKVVRKFTEAGLLRDKEMAKAVGEINKQIHELAPVLNSPAVGLGATVQLTNADVPVDTMVKRYKGATYLFAVGMRDGETKATFSIDGVQPSGLEAEVIGEDRKIKLQGGQFSDAFKPYEVHLYRIKPGR